MSQTVSGAAVFKEARTYGLFMIIAGVLGASPASLAIVYPDITLLALALIAGINLMVLGVLALIDAFGGERETTSRVLAAVIGILGLIAGLVVIRRPGESLLAVVIVLGIWLVVTGFVDFVARVRRARGPRAAAARRARRHRARRPDPGAAEAQPRHAGDPGRDRVPDPRRGLGGARRSPCGARPPQSDEPQLARARRPRRAGSSTSSLR